MLRRLHMYDESKVSLALSLLMKEHKSWTALNILQAYVP